MFLLSASNIFHIFSSVTTVEFQQVNVSWAYRTLVTYNFTSIQKLNEIQQIKNKINISFLALHRQKQTGNNITTITIISTFSHIFNRLLLLIVASSSQKTIHLFTFLFATTSDLCFELMS